MTIGIDIDEVMADFMIELIDFHNHHYDCQGTVDDHHTYSYANVWGCSYDETIKRIFEFYHSPWFDRIKPTAGSQRAIKKLAKSHDLQIITSRSESIKDKTLRWVEEHFPHLFSKVHFTNQFAEKKEARSVITKLAVCQAEQIELVVDDSLETALRCAKGDVRVLLLDMP